MNAFAKTEFGLFKAYRHGDDWQVIGPKMDILPPAQKRLWLD